MGISHKKIRYDLGQILEHLSSIRTMTTSRAGFGLLLIPVFGQPTQHLASRTFQFAAFRPSCCALTIGGSCRWNKEIYTLYFMPMRRLARTAKLGPSVAHRFVASITRCALIQWIRGKLRRIPGIPPFSLNPSKCPYMFKYSQCCLFSQRFNMLKFWSQIFNILNL